MLTEEEQIEFLHLTELQERRQASQPSSDSLAEFIRCCWPIIEPNTPYIHGWHIEAIAEHLEAVVRGEIRNLLINIPPRHAKSTIVSVALPAWWWIPQGWHKFLYASHSDSLSKRDSIKCRNLINSDWYRETFGIKWTLAEDQNEKKRFDNTMGGTRIATSVEASVIGQGADTLVLDDPHSPRSVKSAVQRQSELDWIDQEFFIRVNDPKTTSKIIIMQRLDEADASAHVLEKGGWEHLSLPAEFEGNKNPTKIGWRDPRGTEGDLLWPERFGVTELATMANDLGAVAAAGQLQQRPAPAKGLVIQDEWWRYWRFSELPEFDLLLQSWDLTFDATDNSSFVVGQVWAKKGADKYLLDQRRERAKFTGQLRMVRELSEKWPKTFKKLVEKKANGAALIDTLKTEISGIVGVEVNGGSKVARAESVAPDIQAGNVYLPDPTLYPWVDMFKLEWRTFPNAKNDDQVDATSQAISELRKKSYATDMMPVSITGTSKWI